MTSDPTKQADDLARDLLGFRDEKPQPRVPAANAPLIDLGALFAPAAPAAVLPSMPPLFHRVLRQDLRGHNGGSSTSGIHRWPQTSQTQTFIVFHAMPA